MAVTLKRKRGAVSYKEPSSDDDLSSSDGQEQTTRKQRTAPTRRSTRRPQAVDNASSGSDHPASNPPLGRQRRSRSSRRSQGRQKISYKDVSSDEDDEEDPDADFELAAERVMPVRTRSRPVALASPRAKESRRSKRSKSRRKTVLGASRKPNSEVQAERKVVGIPTDGHKPVCLPSTRTLPLPCPSVLTCYL